MKKQKGEGKRARRKRHAFEVKRRAVKLYLEDGYAVDVVAEELGIGVSTLSAWARRYREQGEAGLKPAGRREGRPQVSAAAKQKAIELKRQHPGFGIKRISHLLRRFFLLKAGPETVRQTLKEEELIPPTPPRPKRNPAKPRFFERTQPNQIWQADIFSFRLGGRSAYLIGYIDDYSRYVTGLDLFRSQTAEHVLEVYRRAVAEYGVPKEMLTDNGRQYTNWRGKTRFELELAKDRIRHIRSQPHHPMTLGKIERLWKTIWGEFLCRAQFDSFEEARERVRLWVAYYNHKRPHQGIGGLAGAAVVDGRRFRGKGTRSVDRLDVPATTSKVAPVLGEVEEPIGRAAPADIDPHARLRGAAAAFLKHVHGRVVGEEDRPGQHLGAEGLVERRTGQDRLDRPGV